MTKKAKTVYNKYTGSISIAKEVDDMKKSLLLLLTVCLLIAPFSVLGEGKIYLALGDSITTGYGLSADEKNFAKLLAEENGYILNNQAVNGATTADVLTLLNRQSILTTVKRAELITLTCGGNDLMGLLFSKVAESYNALAPAPVKSENVISILANPSDPRQALLLAATQSVLLGSENAPGLIDSPVMDAAIDAYITTLNAVIAKLRAVNPTVPIIVATQYNPFGAFTDAYALFGQSMDKGVKKLSDAITRNASTAGYLVADAYSAFAASDENLCCATMTPFNPDPHPTALGHKVLFECFRQVINAKP